MRSHVQPLSVQDLPVVASCCLVKRSKPQRAPPRLVVLSGPSAVGRSRLVARLVADFPDKFGVTVSHTSRPPKEHEVDGRWVYIKAAVLVTMQPAGVFAWLTAVPQSGTVGNLQHLWLLPPVATVSIELLWPSQPNVYQLCLHKGICM